MKQFLIVAAAHFLALLSPGPDFLLIARFSLSNGWRVASGACIGIALANGVFILAAFCGTSVLRPGSMLFVTLQLAGSAYLVYLGLLFLRRVPGSTLMPEVDGRVAGPARPLVAWRRALGVGFLSGILNPKNALFYASLAAMLTGPQTSAVWKTLYGIWMFSIVLLWDALLAASIGNRTVLHCFERVLPWLERSTGLALLLLASSVVAALVLH